HLPHKRRVPPVGDDRVALVDGDEYGPHNERDPGGAAEERPTAKGAAQTQGCRALTASAAGSRRPRVRAEHRIGIPRERPPSCRSSVHRSGGPLSSPAISADPAGEPQSRGPTPRPRSLPCRSIRNAVGVAITPYCRVTAPSVSSRIGIVTRFSLTQASTVDRLSSMLTAMTQSPFRDR